MKRNIIFSIASFLLAVFSVLSSRSNAQPVRTFGAQQFMLDDGVFSDPRVYLTDKNGSLGIDNAGTPNVNFPSTCALLDLSSTTKGFLPPRMNTAQEAAICGGMPPAGLMIYNSQTNSLDVYNGSSWTSISLIGGNPWYITGNAGTNPAINFLGTTDVEPIIFRTNNIKAVMIDAANPQNIIGGITSNVLVANNVVGNFIGNGSNDTIRAGNLNVIGGGNGNQINGT
ncbi:MAG TPA: hypothetical protein VEW28_10660, partial [Candidatus Kapabacteria bacterium]|nr:hypothetical protein [Candidatus Kapabacteria bacterium]